jgi:predicted NAD/FAD-dependent oxidoreductase
LQASPEWSKAHLEEAPDTVISALTQELEILLQISITPLIENASTQRWRYARVSRKESHAPTYLFDAKSDLGLCGDYFSSSRIESAFLSGHGLASTFAQNHPKN